MRTTTMADVTPLRDGLDAVRQAGEERGRARGLSDSQRAALEAVVKMHADDRRTDTQRPA